jgi:uncharacterized Fe-S center protein
VVENSNLLRGAFRDIYVNSLLLVEMNYSDYPYRNCIDCDDVKRCCPKPEILDDGKGTKIPPEDCPKKDKFKMKEQ